MDKPSLQPSSNTEDNAKSGSEWYVLLYSIGALLGLVCAFQPSLSPLQTTNCLVLSWLLALGALMVSLFCDNSEDDQESEQYFDDY